MPAPSVALEQKGLDVDAILGGIDATTDAANLLRGFVRYTLD